MWPSWPTFLRLVTRVGLVRLVGRVGLVALALALAACTQPGPANVLLITLDTTRADHLGAYGYAGARTANFDALADRSTLYERAYSASSWTLPSHASLFTGLLPMQHGAQTAPDGTAKSLGYAVRPLAPHFETLAERFAAAGYQTAAVIAGPALRRELGVAQGFAHYDDDLSRPGDAVNGRRAADVADRAIARLQSFGDGPWLLFVNFFDPHAPYRPPPPHDRGLPEFDDGKLIGTFVARLTSGEPTPDPRPAWEAATLDAMRAGYDAEITYMDQHLGRLLEAVEAAPDETWIVVTADHGESFGEHDFLSHGAHLYENNVRVPLLVHRPGGARARTRVAHAVANRSVFVDLLRGADLAVPEGLRSLDALPGSITLEVGASDANVRLFGRFFDRRLRALHIPPTKWIESSRGSVELYDLSRDPAESRNLASERTGESEALRSSLAAIVRGHPPLFDAEARAELDPETERALRELGYLGD